MTTVSNVLLQRLCRVLGVVGLLRCEHKIRKGILTQLHTIVRCLAVYK